MGLEMERTLTIEVLIKTKEVGTFLVVPKMSKNSGRRRISGNQKWLLDFLR